MLQLAPTSGSSRILFSVLILMKRIHFVVRGTVQGVGFRYFCKDEAIRLSLTGFARNLRDGSVEVEAQGDESVLSEFAKSLSRGPRNANVTSIDREGREIDTEEWDFLIG